jgi:uncharacterized membrane protein/glutaredoxin
MIDSSISPTWLRLKSRFLIGTIAVAGALLTGYLAATKLLGNKVACPVSGCDQVLSSEYAFLLGKPLTLFGCLAYLAMAVLALLPLLLGKKSPRFGSYNLEDITWWLLLFGATSMTVFSSYLMLVLATEIQSWCIYCLVSAAFSVSLLVLTLLGHRWPNLKLVAGVGVLAALLTAGGSFGVYNIAKANAPAEGLAPAITTNSTAAEIGLAKHLKATGATMYGAWWCPHCHEQKQLFGKEASSEINYVECSTPGKKGERKVTQFCLQAGVKAFPQWEFNGKLVDARPISLQELAKLSNYQGDTKFIRKSPYK